MNQSPKNTMVRSPSWHADPDLYALETLMQSLELGKKILKDRTDKIPDVRSQMASTDDSGSWRLSFQNHAQWNPKVSPGMLWHS